MRIMKYSQIQKHKGHKKSLKKDSNFFGILALTDNKTMRIISRNFVNTSY